MFYSGYYPAGAQYDSSAPYNQTDPEAVEKDINYSCNICRDATVETTDYKSGPCEKDEDGFVSFYDDFSETDWVAAFKDTCRTPLQLIEILRDTAKLLSEGKMPEKSAEYWRNVLADCDGWEIEEEYADEI